MSTTLRRGRPSLKTNIVKKYVMAISGLILFSFVVGHMAGNLKLFLGATELNHYAEWLRTIGTPILPPSVGLWILRIGLLGAFAAHVGSAFAVTRASKKARPDKYRVPTDYIAANYASRTMIWSGIIVLAFIVYHLTHFTWGIAHPDFIRGDVYHNVVAGFENPIVSGFYILANLALGFHLYHGLWSMFQSLGATSPRWHTARRRFAQTFAAAIVAGNCVMPIAVVTGFVS